MAGTRDAIEWWISEGYEEEFASCQNQFVEISVPFLGFSLGQFLRSSINLLHAEYSCYNWIYSFLFFLFLAFNLIFLLFDFSIKSLIHMHTPSFMKTLYFFLVLLFIVLKPCLAWQINPGLEPGRVKEKTRKKKLGVI
jgi:hypothetical protein